MLLFYFCASACLSFGRQMPWEHFSQLWNKHWTCAIILTEHIAFRFSEKYFRRQKYRNPATEWSFLSFNLRIFICTILYNFIEKVFFYSTSQQNTNTHTMAIIEFDICVRRPVAYIKKTFLLHFFLQFSFFRQEFLFCWLLSLLFFTCKMKIDKHRLNILNRSNNNAELLW